MGKQQGDISTTNKISNVEEVGKIKEPNSLLGFFYRNERINVGPIL